MTGGADRLVLGWSRAKVTLPSNARVLDVGCGGFPNARADVACDRSLDEDQHRTGRETVVDRPFVLADASHLPFRDGAFDFVIASHIAEHVDEPLAFCGELSRVALSGYIETPSPLADFLLDEEYHRWRVGERRGRLRFLEKGPRGAVTRRVTDLFYALFYAGRGTGEKFTLELPSGLVGRIVDVLLLVGRGALNRSGVMHTRVHFAEGATLEADVLPLKGPARSNETHRARLTFIDRSPRSGFLEGDRRSLERNHDLDVVRYPGWPTLSFLYRCVSSLRRSDALYCFFAGEHAVVPIAVARSLGRPVLLVTGGYDVADVPAIGYGLGRRRRRWLPRALCRHADLLLAMSESAAAETTTLAPDVAPRVVSIPLALEDSWSREAPDVRRDADLVVTVGYVDDRSFRRKGIDRFIDLARRDKAREYVLAGRIAPGFESHLGPIPENLRLAGYLDDEELWRLLWSAGIYAQLSRHEGFGMSMVEAMACGCVPLLSDLGVLAEVTGGYGQVLEPKAPVRSVMRAASTELDREAMRQWVLARYSIESRASALAAAVAIVRARP